MIAVHNDELFQKRTEGAVGIIQAEHVGKVVGKPQAGSGCDGRLAEQAGAVNPRRDHRQTGDDIKGILQSRLPMILPGKSLVIAAGKMRFPLHRQHGRAEQHHRMGVIRHAVKHLPHIGWHLRPAGQLLLQLLQRSGAGQFSGTEQEKDLLSGPFHQGKHRQPPDKQPFLGIDIRGIAQHRIYPAHPFQKLFQGDGGYNRIAIFLQQLADFRTPLGDFLCEGVV